MSLNGNLVMKEGKVSSECILRFLSKLVGYI